MWLLFHRNAKTRVVRDGRSFVETCPECRIRARFVEVEVTEGIGLFFIDLISDKERKYRCTACGDVFDLRDQADETAAARTSPLFGGAVARREAVELQANRIEDELAELKKRMGR